MPYNTANSKKSEWNEFSQLLEEMNYNLEIDNLSVDWAKIFDYGYKIKKNGQDYRVSSIKS